jgi:hypothetical protein
LTKRTLRHWEPKVKAAGLSLAVFFIAYLAGACLLGAWTWTFRRPAFAALLLVCALVLAVLAVLVAGKIDAAYRRWTARPEPIRRRCYSCLRPIEGQAFEFQGKPYCAPLHVPTTLRQGRTA